MPRTTWEAREIPLEYRRYFEEVQVRCGKPWERVVEKEKPPANVYTDSHKPDAIKPVSHPEIGKAGMGQKLQNWYNEHPQRTTGWRPGCNCCEVVARNGDLVVEPFEAVPCTILDPFSGTGTTGLVADRLGRDAILIDLNPDYCQMAYDRIKGENPMFTEVTLE